MIIAISDVYQSKKHIARPVRLFDVGAFADYSHRLMYDAIKYISWVFCFFFPVFIIAFCTENLVLFCSRYWCLVPRDDDGADDDNLG